jgi:inositol 1,4,5-triphosphate receptor type 1/inositol 1,4,5-triphosphate receptor type 3
MSQFFMNRTNLVNRMLDKPEDFTQLQDFYNKILILMIGVLEGNDEKIYEDIQSKLEARFLIDFLK